VNRACLEPGPFAVRWSGDAKAPRWWRGSWPSSLRCV